MLVAIDLSLCQGYGNCVSAAPDYFDIDDAGQAVLRKAHAVSPEEIEQVRAAVPMCPVAAITLHEGERE
ncbi:ferredoxin [Nocardia sp. X0981]